MQAMPNIARAFARSLTFLIASLLLGGVAIKPAHAHIIERVEINQAGDEAEIQIIFDVRIQYLREASLGSGDIHLFFNQLEADPSGTRLVSEAKDSPPSEITPHFTISYPELDSSLAIKFDNTVSYRVRPGKEGRSISIFIPAVKPESPESKLALRTAEEVEREAKQLLVNARDAMGQGQLGTAIETLNRLLNLPPNQQSQAAQGLIGEAREKNGEFAKARVEYELYLKLHPDAADAQQVKGRLARLPEEEKAKSVPLVFQKKAVEEKMMVYGSFSQNYYNGMSHTDVTTANGLGVTTDSLTSTDTSTLLTSLDMTGRKRTENTDTRIVFRDDYRANFLSKTKNDNRLSAFYIEQSGRDRSYLVRLGRQRGSSGGMPGRFDGAWLGYSLSSAWRVNGVAGTPVEFYGSEMEKKNFAGLSVDLTRLPEQWSGSAYMIEQRVGKVTDRQAVGMETHYFDAQRNYLGLLEYDRLFKAVNIAMFQGNWTTGAGDNYLMLADHRKSPPLQITNALPGQTSQSIAALVQSGVSTESLRADAKALSQTSNLFMVGMTHPLSSRWRLGGDFRISNISGTGASGVLPASAGTGNTYIYSAQAIGNGLLQENDLGVASASYIDAQNYKGQSLGYTQVENFRQRWRLDISLQLYNQKDILDIRQRRTIPSVKLSYQMNQSVSFDAEGGIEDTRTTSATQVEKISRKYVYLGYRWDFR
ncbi:MAG: hypothetical protein A2V79_01025 [Betaproteobacteria bacterium RBG_16_56_24]|nr:MAG: hypothetical protein A2V79_01025 [Betaproteobacteria bacterium RBG_16_56_24]